MFLELLDTLFGVFDLIIILLIVLGNVYIYKTKKISFFPWYIHLILILSFILVLPLFSGVIEYRTYIEHCKVTPDGFETVYIWLRWPTYWGIGLFEGIVLNLILIRNSKINEGWGK